MAELSKQSIFQLSNQVRIEFGQNLGISSVKRADFEGVLAIVLHHTAGGEVGLVPSLKSTKRGYHYAISQADQQGQIRIQELVPPWLKTGGASGTLTANHGTVHIAFIGFKPSQPQIEAAKELILSD